MAKSDAARRGSEALRERTSALSAAVPRISASPPTPRWQRSGRTPAASPVPAGRHRGLGGGHAGTVRRPRRFRVRQGTPLFRRTSAANAAGSRILSRCSRIVRVSEHSPLTGSGIQPSTPDSALRPTGRVKSTGPASAPHRTVRHLRTSILKLGSVSTASITSL